MNEMTQQLDLPLWDPIVYSTTGTSGTITMCYGYWAGWSRDDELRIFVKRGFGILIIAAMFIVPMTIIGLL